MNTDDLFDDVKKNEEHGFYMLDDKYRKKMNDFYENEYYQHDHALYQHNEYDTVDMAHKNNFYAQKLYIIKKYSGGGGVYFGVSKFLRHRLRRRFRSAIFL